MSKRLMDQLLEELESEFVIKESFFSDIGNVRVITPIKNQQKKDGKDDDDQKKNGKDGKDGKDGKRKSGKPEGGGKGGEEDGEEDGDGGEEDGDGGEEDGEDGGKSGDKKGKGKGRKVITSDDPDDGEGELEDGDEIIGHKKKGETDKNGKPVPGKPGKEGEEGKTGTVEFREDGVYINGRKVSDSKVVDDHSKMDQSVSKSMREMFKEVYKKARELDRNKTRSDGSGGTGNMIRKGLEDMIKPQFDVGAILERLKKFKKQVSMEMVNSRAETFQASPFNPANQKNTSGARMNLPGDADIGSKVKEGNASCVLIFALDTSGSITPRDFDAIKTYLREIVNEFSKGQPMIGPSGKEIGKMYGEVYLLEWDHTVHLPMRKWTKVQKNGKIIPEITSASHLSDKKSKDYEKFSVRGGGGNDMNEVFRTIDTLFYRESGGKKYIDIDDTADYVTGRDLPEDGNLKKLQLPEFKKNVASRTGHFRAEIKAKPIKVTPSTKEINYEPGKVNVTMSQTNGDSIPFLLVYTDAQWTKADYKTSKLYENNPGNILYIVTSGYDDVIRNISPPNFVYHDLSGERTRKR